MIVLYRIRRHEDRHNGDCKSSRYLDGREALSLAPGIAGANAAIHWLGLGIGDRPHLLLVVHPDHLLWPDPAARYLDRDRHNQPAGRSRPRAGAGPLLPVVHFSVSAIAVRRFDLRRLDDCPRPFDVGPSLRPDHVGGAGEWGEYQYRP